LEAIMKTLTALSLALAILAVPAITNAQEERSSSGAISDKAHSPDDASAANKPQSQPAETTGQKVEIHDEGKAKDQPAMATGEDLKGPAKQFAPSKTPE
jgi:hypothetical protein